MVAMETEESRATPKSAVHDVFDTAPLRAMPRGTGGREESVDARQWYNHLLLDHEVEAASKGRAKAQTPTEPWAAAFPWAPAAALPWPAPRLRHAATMCCGDRNLRRPHGLRQPNDNRLWRLRAPCDPPAQRVESPRTVATPCRMARCRGGARTACLWKPLGRRDGRFMRHARSARVPSIPRGGKGPNGLERQPCPEEASRARPHGTGGRRIGGGH